jgi:hypothetical protein
LHVQKSTDIAIRFLYLELPTVENIMFITVKFMHTNVLVQVLSVSIVSRITIGGGVVSSQVALRPSTCSCTVSTTLSRSSTLKMLPLHFSILVTHLSWFSSSFF